MGVEAKEIGEFIGRIGIEKADYPEPCVELGYRLAFKHWGKGYAAEGSFAALRYGFENSQFKRNRCIYTDVNWKSRASLGMHHGAKDDFDHPKVPEGNALQRHVLYRIHVMHWQNNRIQALH